MSECRHERITKSPQRYAVGHRCADCGEDLAETDLARLLAEARAERDATLAEAKRLREALEYQIEMWESVPPGPDYDAREDDCSPEDMVAWQAGVAIRAGKAALAAPSDPPKEAPRE